MAFLLSLASALLFGLLPPGAAPARIRRRVWKSGGCSSTGARNSGSVRSLLVALEVGLSTVCLVAAGLLLNSFVRLMHVDKGFTAERITTVNVSLPATRYPGMPQRAEFVRKMIDQVKTSPASPASAVTNFIPLDRRGQQQYYLAPEGTLQSWNNPVADQSLDQRRLSSKSDGHSPDMQGRVFEPGGSVAQCSRHLGGNGRAPLAPRKSIRQESFAWGWSRTPAE